jgi:hypothetical protein
MKVVGQYDWNYYGNHWKLKISDTGVLEPNWDELTVVPPGKIDIGVFDGY